MQKQRDAARGAAGHLSTNYSDKEFLDFVLSFWTVPQVRNAPICCARSPFGEHHAHQQAQTPGFLPREAEKGHSFVQGR